MRYTRRSSLFWLGAFCTLLLAGCQGSGGDTDVGAADFPRDSIELTVPHPAGGGTDVANRLFEPALEDELGTSIDVVVRDGGAGGIAVSHVMEQPADGYNLIGIESGIVSTGPAGNPELVYDPADLKPVGRITDDPWVLLASQDTDLQSMDDFTERLRGSDPVVVGIAGVMSSDHYALMLLLQGVSDAEIRYVTYGGGGPKRQALYGGEAHLILDTADAIDEELATPLAVLSEERLTEYPDLVTAAEAGYDDAVASLWQGLAVHIDTPNEIVEVLSGAIESAASSDDFRTRAAESGLHAAPLPEEEFDQFIADEYERAEVLVEELSDVEIVD